MHPLPRPLPSLFYASLAVSTATLALSLAGISLNASPLLWVIPIAYTATLPYHITLLALARVEPHGSARLFSKFKTACAFAVSVLWTTAFGVAVAAIVLNVTNTLPKYENHIWIIILSSAFSLVELALMWTIAILIRKERSRITYWAKWRPIINGSQGWSINRST